MNTRIISGGERVTAAHPVDGVATGRPPGFVGTPRRPDEVEWREYREANP